LRYAVVDPDQPSPRVVVIVVVVQMAVRPNADMERPYHKRAPERKPLTKPCDFVNGTSIAAQPSDLLLGEANESYYDHFSPAKSRSITVRAAVAVTRRI
jgi:hypothetical protein